MVRELSREQREGIGAFDYCLAAVPESESLRLVINGLLNCLAQCFIPFPHCDSLYRLVERSKSEGLARKIIPKWEVRGLAVW